jgi:hypothetical protein
MIKKKRYESMNNVIYSIILIIIETIIIRFMNVLIRFMRPTYKF